MRSEKILNPARRIEIIIVMLAAIVPLVVKLTCYPDYPGSDDAFIHMTVVRNLARGNGWSIEPGNPVNVSTSPLFTLFLTVLAILGLSGIEVAQAVSMISTIACILVMHRTSTYLSNVPLLRVCSVLLAAFQVHLWRWSGVAMETTFASMFVLLAFHEYYRLFRTPNNRLPVGLALGLIIGLAFLARPELGLLLPSCVIPFLSFRVARRFSTMSWILAGFSIPASGWAWFSHMYFGAVIPTTFYAKTQAFHLWNAQVALEIVTVLASGVTPALLLMAVLAVLLMRGKSLVSDPSLWQDLAPALLFPMALFAFYVTKTNYLQSPARYCLPALLTFPLGVAVLAQGSWKCGHQTALRRLVIFFAACQCLSSVYVNHEHVVPALRGFKSNYWRVMKEAAEELASRCMSGETVLVESDIGIVSYEQHGRCRIADGGALASPELRGLSLSEQIVRSRADYVLESLGRSRYGLVKTEERLQPVRSWTFRSHAVVSVGSVFFCNLYRVGPLRS